MEAVYIVLLLLTMLYIPIWLYTKLSPDAKKYGLATWGPLVMIRTKVGIEAVGKVGRHKKLWKICGKISRIVVIFLMAYIVIVLLIDLILLPFAIGNGGLGIEYALAIPGINPMLPIVYGWIGLIVAMVVHEFAHGIQTKANDMEVKSTGVLYGVVPLGAFVEPNDEQLKSSSRGAKIDVYAAGITTNFIVAVICFALMSGMFAGAVDVQSGDNAAVYGTSFDENGNQYCIANTGIITHIEFADDDGIDNPTIDGLNGYLGDNKFQTYEITYLYKGENRTIDTYMGVYINEISPDTPAAKAGMKSGCYIKSVELGGNTYDFGTVQQWSSFMETTDPGDEITIVTVKNGEDPSEPITVTLGSSDDRNYGYLGVMSTTGGYNFITPNDMKNSALNPFYGQSTFEGYALSIFTFIGKPFQGMSPVPEATHWWFHCTFLPDDAFWVITSLLFWIFWLDIVLGVTNALPAVPFDGGFIYAGGVDYILEKYGIVDNKMREEKVNRIVGFTSTFSIVVMIMIMAVIIF